MRHALLLASWLAIGGTCLANQATFAGLDQAKHLYGDKITAADLKGKVVFFEYWGVRCPPCRDSFPHLIALQKKHADSGKFTVLASHVQADEQAAAAFCREQKVNFPVFHQFREPAAPCPGGIPHAALIDHEGKVIAQGHPNQLLDKVEAAIKLVPDKYPMLGNMEVKHWEAQAKKMASDKPAAMVLNQLRQAAAKGDDAKATEAAAMVAAIEHYLVEQREKLKAQAETQPARTLLETQDLRRAIAGLDGEDEVKDLLADLQRNPAAVRLAGLLKRIDETQAKIKAKPGRSLTKQLAQLKKQVQNLANTDDASVGAEAKAVAESLPGD